MDRTLEIGKSCYVLDKGTH